MLLGEVEVIHRPGDDEIGIGVEAVDEGQALVTEIAFDLEIGLETVSEVLAVLQIAPELAMQGGLRKIGDMGPHARHREAPVGALALEQVVAAAPVGVGHDRLAADLVKGDVLGRGARGGGDGHRREDLFGIAHGPVQRLHAAHGAADDAEQPADAEMVDEKFLRLDHVADGDDREIEAVGLVRRRIDFRRPHRAQTAAEKIAADDEIAVGIEGLAGPDHDVPPALLAGHRMIAGEELIAGEGMADEDGVRFRLVEPAVSLIGHGEGAERHPAVEAQRLIDPEFDPVAGQLGGIRRLRFGGRAHGFSPHPPRVRICA